MLRATSTEGRSVCLCWEHSKPNLKDLKVVKTEFSTWRPHYAAFSGRGTRKLRTPDTSPGLYMAIFLDVRSYAIHMDREIGQWLLVTELLNLLQRFRHYYLTRATTRTMTDQCSPVQPGSEGFPPKICADKVSDEDKGQVQRISDRWTDPI